MSTLLLRLAAPMQSWGIDGKFEDRRPTERIPTKSGVIGLIAAALGRMRNESIADLCELRYGVRVDRQGVLLRDYHTAKSEKSAYITNRYYLADAVFLAGLEGIEARLDEIAAALERPKYPLFLGRRSCPPEGKLLLGIRPNVGVEEALMTEPRLVNLANYADNTSIYTDANPQDKQFYFSKDRPVSFNQEHRQYGFRRVREITSKISVFDNVLSAASIDMTQHDPMLELEE